jgi:hypothetical protein
LRAVGNTSNVAFRKRQINWVIAEKLVPLLEKEGN